MTSSSAKGPLSKQHGPRPASSFITEDFSTRNLFFFTTSLFFRCKLRRPHYQIPFELRLLYSMWWQQWCVFPREAFKPSKDPDIHPFPPLLHSTAPLPPSKCVAMETATWVCCSCLSCRYKRCTTHLTISWWIEGWWLTGRVRCLVARRTTFSLCRYSPSLPGIAAVKPPSFAWQRVALMTKPCLAMHNNAQFEGGGKRGLFKI